MWRGLKVYSGVCPDPECHTKLYFPSYASSSVECTGCGQHHGKESLLNVEDVHDPDLALRNLLRSALLGQNSSKTTPDLVKVKGYSNYHCKLLSPLLTFYGMEKRTGEAKLLRELSQVDMFDCSLLGDRAFQIESEHMETAGYGRDKTGSAAYLKDTLEAIKIVNDNEERLIPVHVDGDGHCLVHAISRALVGREIFWHALRANLKNHLETEILKYKGVFQDFIDDSEWEEIISEADPYFQPPEGQGLGLRNIHLFGLANVLHRPIILLDSVSGMQSSGDYSGIFLPALIPADKCKSKDNILNRPLAVAWSSLGRNHFIPLVGVKGKPVPKLPQWLIPKAWGIPNEVVKQYMEFDSHGHCFIGGQRCLQDKYIQRLVKAMDDLFLEKNSIAAHLVTEVHQFVYKPSGMVGVKPEIVTMAAQAAIADGRLYRCLSCYALRELYLDVPADMLKPGGDLYTLAVQSHGPLQEGVSYSFPSYQGLVCVFDAERDVLVPIEQKDVTLLKCHLCHGLLRRVRSDGSVVYVNGDRTTTPVKGQSRCGCGFKHYWNAKEYDNMPEFFPISLEWGGKTVSETVYWFQYEADPSYNSNAYDVATKLVQRHFPGEFGSERLVQKVVDTILRQTAKKEVAFPAVASSVMTNEQSSAGDTSFTPSKIILTGEKKKTFHREELTKSETERVLKTRTEHHAAVMQKRRSGEEAKKAPEKGAKIAKQQSGTKPQQDSSPPSQGVSKDTPALSAPPAQSSVARTDKKVQLSTSDGKRRMLTIAMDTTFKQLQQLIERALGIPPGEQKIRYGFPPCELQPPEEGQGEDPVPLQHNDRVMVEHLKPAAPGGHPPDIVMGGVNNVAMASALIDALGTLTGVDMWEGVQSCHEMFDRGGYYYNMVANDLGSLSHNQHCTIPGLPKKVFVYNATKDRLELCLGERHIQVQPLDNETLMLANTRPIQAPTVEPSSGLSSEASFSGAIGHRDTSHSRVAFSGQGRTLSGASTSKKNPAESLPKLTSTSQASELTLPLEPRTALISSIDPQVDLSEGELQKLAVEDNAATQQEQITSSDENATITKQMREQQEEAMENKPNTNEMPVESPKSVAMETDQSEGEAPSSSGLESSDDSTRREAEELRESQELSEQNGDVVEPGTGAQGIVVVDQTENEKIVVGDKENASEGMETEQLCVTQDVTPVSVTPLSMEDAEVTERQEVKDIATSNTNLPETIVTDDQVNSDSSDDAVSQASVAMEIDNQSGSSAAESSPDKPEVAVNNTPTNSEQETEILNSVDSKEPEVLKEDEVGSTDDSESLKQDYEAKKSAETTEISVKLQDTIAVDGSTSDQMILEKS